MSLYIIAVILILLAVPLFMGKGTFLIAGYNTMTPKEKEEYNKKHNVKKMCKAAGFMLLAIAIILLIMQYYNRRTVDVYCIATIIAASLFFVTYLNAGCRKD